MASRFGCVTCRRRRDGQWGADLRVLYVIDSLVPGGAERSLVGMAPGYRQYDIDLHVAHLLPTTGIEGELQRIGIDVHSLSGDGGRLGSVRRTIGLIRELRPDLVHTTLFEADQAGRAAARWTRTPVVSSLVNVAYGPEHRRAPGIRAGRLELARQMDAFTCRWVARFHAITRHVADVMAPRLRIPRDAIEVIPRGRAPDRLGRRTAERKDQVRKQLRVGDGTPLLLAAGRHEHQKGLDVLVHAFASIKDRAQDAVLLIAGREGNATDDLHELVQERRLTGDVRLLGPRRDLSDLMCGADVFVLPSRWEGLGGVLLEAMALELPIVASDLPAVREVVQHGETALLVPSEDPKALADSALELIRDQALRERLTARARGRFDSEFAIDRVVDKMIRFYERSMASVGIGKKGRG